jgi:hypothetical protein
MTIPLLATKIFAPAAGEYFIPQVVILNVHAGQEEKEKVLLSVQMPLCQGRQLFGDIECHPRKKE